ncbi:MAG: hypothetical protein V4664_03320 [Patescibacteria group bacterium]
MKHTHVPKIFIGVTFLFAVLLFIGDRPVAFGQSGSGTSTKYLTGFAWSSNIGWISVRGSNYSVQVSPTGALSGYSWSPNIGWVSFNPADVSSCPSGNGPCSPNIDLLTGAITGWARACSGTQTGNCSGAERTDGWAGWIHLSGSNHASPQTDGNGGLTYYPATSRLKGYAWGSDVVGWINFNGVTVITNNDPIVDPEEYGPEDDSSSGLPPVISLFKMIPNTVQKDQSCTMNWEVVEAEDCTISGQGYTEAYDVSLPTGSDLTAPITSAQSYTLTCSNAAGSSSKTAACRLNPSSIED